MAGDPLQDRLQAIADQQVAALPYALESSAEALLTAKIESGVATMRAANRTDADDVALAERHLRSLLAEAKGRMMLLSSGEAVVAAEGLTSILVSDKWWPF
ncbi:MAG TPA: hypothetical protein VMH33_00400 [Solirubrobacterales bacterium]|nr:hypothetical protein [Solirubrobacterales bacterium]